MKRLLLPAAAISALAFVPGCLTAAKEAYGAVRGAQGVYAEVRPVADAKEARPLGIYRRFELGGFSDEMGGKVPPELLELLPGEFTRAMLAKKLPNESGGRTLLIRGSVIHYEDEKLVGAILGPLEEVVARVELVDKETGRSLGLANLIGRTGERVNMGIRKKAEGLAKAIANWIDSRYPLEGRADGR